MSGEECQCGQARAWARAYWHPDAIAVRLRHEIALYRRIFAEMDGEARAALWGDLSDQDIGYVPRTEPLGSGDTHEVLAARRADATFTPKVMFPNAYKRRK